MDKIDKATLEEVAEQHPKAAITLFRGFLTGTRPDLGDHPELGFVPADWDGVTKVVVQYGTKPT